MLYWLLYEKLFHTFTPFRVFQYNTFRTAFASLTALFLLIVLGPWLIRKLREFQVGQYIREEGPKSHMKKAGTPDDGRCADASSPCCYRHCCGQIYAIRTCGSRLFGMVSFGADRVLRRFHQGAADAQPGADGAR